MELNPEGIQVDVSGPVKRPHFRSLPAKERFEDGDQVSGHPTIMTRT